MKVFAPQYYRDFRCIAGACRHSCCEGWEIDIDSESLERYRNTSGELGDVLRANISCEGDPHFVLREGDRCPFLRADGLCRLIIEKGEDFLCQICSDHPRFRNFWNDRIEIGLGMACEEAARLILSQTQPMRLIVLEDDGIDEGIPEDEEYLMEVREELLSGIAETGPRARLLEYLIYRHIADALYDDRLEERIAFVRYAFEEITSACAEDSIAALAEAARDFSQRIEYNTEKQDEILDGFWTEEDA